MKHDKAIGKILYHTPLEQNCKEFRRDRLSYFWAVIFVLFGLVVSVGMIANFFVYDDDAWFGLVFGVVATPIFGNYLLGTFPALYSTKLYTVGDKGAMITMLYWCKKEKIDDVFIFANAKTLEMTQTIDRHIGRDSITHDYYRFLDHTGKLVFEEVLTYVSPSDLDKLHKKEYVQTLIDAFERYRITRKGQ
jgi:hypothetical protein